MIYWKENIFWDSCMSSQSENRNIPILKRNFELSPFPEITKLCNDILKGKSLANQKIREQTLLIALSVKVPWILSSETLKRNAFFIKKTCSRVPLASQNINQLVHFNREGILESQPIRKFENEIWILVVEPIGKFESLDLEWRW